MVLHYRSFELAVLIVTQFSRPSKLFSLSHLGTQNPYPYHENSGSTMTSVFSDVVMNLVPFNRLPKMAWIRMYSLEMMVWSEMRDEETKDVV